MNYHRDIEDIEINNKSNDIANLNTNNNSNKDIENKNNNDIENKNNKIAVEKFDRSMQIPNVRNIIGLEYNIDPLKIAKKKILQNIPQENCRKLESLSLWHGSILNFNIAEEIFKEGSGEVVNNENKNMTGEQTNIIKNNINTTINNNNNNNNINNHDDNNDNTYKNNQLKSKDIITAVSCIEVIEHLPSREHAAQALKTILNDFQPDYAIFSTPNYESNRAIKMAVMGKPYTQPLSDSIFKKKKIEICDNNDNGKDNNENNKNVHDIQKMTKEEEEEKDEEPFREADHKFEFTRKEFRDWAYDGLKSVFGEYEVSFTEVGAVLPGMGGCYGGEKIVLNFQEENTRKSEDKNENNNKNDENNNKNNIKNENSIDNNEYNNNINENYNNSNQNVMMGYDDKDGSLKRSRERGCGGASQVAIFKKIKGEGNFFIVFIVFVLF